jgi:hypothetical protein
MKKNLFLNSNSDNNDEFNSPKKRNKFLIENRKITHNSNLSVNNINFYQRNNAMKFSNYSSRKDNAKSIKNPILSYNEPENILKSVKNSMINFGKMKERNINDIFNINNYPAVCYYNPNLKYTQKNQQYSLKFKIEKNTDKKFLIKKMWGSYDVPTNYKFVELENHLK